MSLTSNVPTIQFTNIGLVIPQEIDILAGVQADMNNAFGGGLNYALETPQGQLASSQTAIIGDKNNEIATIVNQIDPQYSDGRFQDAIGRLYFLTRKPATATTVVCTLRGVPGVTIPAGTIAQDTSGNMYFSVGSGTIGLNNQVEVVFQNIKTGNIPCPIGELIKVYQSISGWNSIENLEAGIPGFDVESRVDFEYRRKNSVALNGRGTLNSIYSSVFSVSNVKDVYVVENSTDDIVEYGETDYPLRPHSIYVAADGGLDSEIAYAIWSKKDVGCDYNGNTEVVVSDDMGYLNPLPSYTVRFERPESFSIFFSITIMRNPKLPYGVDLAIQRAVVDKFYGSDGSQRERIGSTVVAGSYYAAVSSVSKYITILSIKVGSSAPGAAEQITLGIDQLPSLSYANILVTIV